MDERRPQEQGGERGAERKEAAERNRQPDYFAAGAGVGIDGLSYMRREEEVVKVRVRGERLANRIEQLGANDAPALPDPGNL